MHLEPCEAPSTALVPAPLTSLCRPTDGERWDGFWSAEHEASGRETYYLRCQIGTAVQWFRMVNVEPDARERARPARRVRTA